MKLTVREAAALLDVPETKIYRWVDDEVIPFVMIHHHPRFHRVELLEWAMEEELPVGVDLYEDGRDQPFTRALERGGGRVLDGGLVDLASDLPIAGEADREVVRSVIASHDSEMFVSRAADQIAIPRARCPIVCPDAPACVCLWWSGPRTLMIDNVATKEVFVILAPTIRQHLQLLSRLALSLHDAKFRAAVQRTGEFAPLLTEARRWEQAIEVARR